jgi:hypothetical protein
MIRYQPIFKGKPAEYDAWLHAAAAVKSAADPFYELAEGGDRYLKTFVKKVAAGHTLPGRVTVDASAVDQTVPLFAGGPRVIEWLGREFAAGSVPMRTVVRAGDPAAVMADAALVDSRHGQGVVLRVGTQDIDPDVATLAADIPAVLAQLGIPQSSLHLLLDYQYLSSTKDVARAVPGANNVLAWIASQTPFGSVFVGSGAFPASISGLPVATANLLARYDAAFFAALTIPAGLNVGFSDYAVNHPAAGPNIPRPPLPALRYAVGAEWLVWREKKARPGNESFFTVSARVASSGSFSGAGYSWGDDEIIRCASSTGGAGTPTQWRAFATSHHLAFVVDRLATLGAP